MTHHPSTPKHQSSDKHKQRLNTVRRPAPKVTLKSNWHSQQQQQQQLSLRDDVSTCTKQLVTEQSGIRDVRGYTTDETSTRKLVRDSEPVVDKKPQIEIDVRVEGVSQDAILQDEEKLRQSTKSWKSFKWDQAQNPFVTICRKKGNMIFSEESSRAIYEIGNMELVELRQTSAAIQCPSCLKHVPEGLNMCPCGVWLRSNQSTMDRIRAASTALKTSYYRTSVILSRGRKSGHSQ